MKRKTQFFPNVFLCSVPLLLHRALLTLLVTNRVEVLSPEQIASLQYHLDVLQSNLIGIFTQRYLQVPQLRVQFHRTALPPYIILPGTIHKLRLLPVFVNDWV